MFKKLNDARKAMRDGPGLTAQLAPDDAVVVDAPADFALPAVEAALRGEHAPAAELLAWTRQNQAWGDRSHLVSTLGQASLQAPQWLEAWRAEAPDDPDLAVVASRLLVLQAWEQRSHARAKDVTREQFEAFHTTLADATAQIQRAVDLSPGDPEPWALAIVHARGLEAPADVLRGYVETLWEVDRYHYEGTSQAMQFLAKKWFGSHEQMYAFVHEAVDGAPADARIQELPLDAVLEHLAEDPSTALTQDPARVEDAVRRGQAYVEANADAGHHLTAQTRNLLVRVLFHLHRFDDAYDQLVAVGPHATEFPWGYWGDAREEFLTHRRHVVTKKATGS